MPDWRMGAARDLPLGPDRTWDGAAAQASIFAWAGWPDDPTPAKARRGFLVYDASAPELKGSYKLAFCQVIDGELLAMPQGVRAAASRLPQTDIPQGMMDMCRAVLDGYLERMREESGKRAPSPREYKTIPQFTKAIEDRAVTGIFAVHGNIDDGGDRGHPGLFGDGTVAGRRRAVFLWQHNSSEPPIASIDRIYEVDAGDLPPAVKLYAPDATGGVAVQRTYLSDDPATRPGLILAGLKAGAIAEMSYAYEPTKWDFEEQDDGRTVRNLYKADLFDISDVNWGMNPATSATGQKGHPLHIEHDTVRAAVQAYTERLQSLAALRAKEGRVLSGENRKRVEGAIEALDGAIGALRDLLAAGEPGKGHAETHALRAAWARQQQRLRELGVTL